MAQALEVRADLCGLDDREFQNIGTCARRGRPHTHEALGKRVRSPPSPPSILDSAEVLQKQAFLEPPEIDGVAPWCGTMV
jgi:hypothetical protein